jgi:hypothetical protein
VGLVADDEIPPAVGRCQLGLHVLVAGELVEPGDDEVVLQEPVAGAGGFELIVGENLEGELEAVEELVLPLVGEAARADHKAALKVAARDELLHEQAGHDGLAGARIVGQQETQGLARQHLLVDGGNLVRQGHHQRGMNGEHRIEEVREADAVRLGDETEEMAVTVEAPWAPLLGDLESRLVVPVQQLAAELPARVFVGQLQGFRAEPLHADDRHQGIRKDATERGVGLEVFEVAHWDSPITS